ncbi:hypothetical protein [Pseudomonas indica]|uniref:hypothetical protein n=1 Tax=Pseudomonas indica TaxID=137658 RepID=UPI0023F62332|nr:hypothetical protein [Pseudomonas indica]MBU3055850.1 hypothetical protein [Pseudomonas indica]
MARPRGSAYGNDKGRAQGRLNKAAREELQAKVADDILHVYERLGGVEFLARWAKKNESEFIRQCWTRIAPPVPRETDQTNVQVNTAISGGRSSDVEAARRIAFALSRAVATEEDRKAALLGSPARPPVALQDTDPGVAFRTQAAEALEMKQEAEREAARTREAEEHTRRMEEHYAAHQHAEEHFNAAEQGIRRTGERHSLGETVRRKR